MGASPFPVHPGALRGIAQKVSRPRGFLPATDIALWLAVQFCAHQEPRSHLEWEDDGLTVQGLRWTRVLDALGHERSSRGDFSSSSWKTISRSRKRLAKTPVEFEYTVFVRGVVEKCWEEPLLYLGAQKEVTIGCVPPQRSRYFCLVSPSILPLFRVLSHDAARLVCWLLYRRRGSSRARTLLARSACELNSGLAREWRLGPGSEVGAWRALLAAVTLLEEVEAVKVVDRWGGGVQVALSPGVFGGKESS